MTRITKLEVATLMAKAEKTNRHRDRMDSKNGFSSPSDGPPDMTCRTIICALEAGLSTGDVNCIAEGLDMLVDYESTLRKDGGKFQPWTIEL